MTQSKQTVIFFDLDGTLIVNPFDRAVWPVVLGEIAAKSGLDEGEIFKLLVAESAARQHDETSSPVLSMDWDDITQTIAARLGISLEAHVESLVRENVAISSILDNGADVLRELNARHRALVVATKGLAKYQIPVLAALGLMPLFAAALTPDTHHALKKHRAFFGNWPDRTRLQIMVGDMYDDDVQYPAGHGFKTVWKRPNLDSRLAAKDPFARALLYPYADNQAVQADAIIQSLQELPAVVRRLEQAVLGFSD